VDLLPWRWAAAGAGGWPGEGGRVGGRPEGCWRRFRQEGGGDRLLSVDALDLQAVEECWTWLRPTDLQKGGVLLCVHGLEKTRPWGGGVAWFCWWIRWREGERRCGNGKGISGGAVAGMGKAWVCGAAAG